MKEKTRDLVLRAIENEWPLSVSHVAKKLNETNGQKYTIQSVKYHFDSLAEKGDIRLKKIGRNLVAWPAEIEKLRMIHELLR
ncbi:MAG: hypothetical protein HYT72_02735 [Candidatus Aenigmarchaeota archaeon]|nr:hypothetical protein [Candidatus Aenigmarchaeota archaeon]